MADIKVKLELPTKGGKMRKKTLTPDLICKELKLPQLEDVAQFLKESNNKEKMLVAFPDHELHEVLSGMAMMGTLYKLTIKRINHLRNRDTTKLRLLGWRF